MFAKIFYCLWFIFFSTAFCWQLNESEFSVTCKKPCFNQTTQWPKVYDGDADTCATMGMYQRNGISLEIVVFNETLRDKVDNVSVTFEGSVCDQSTLNGLGYVPYGAVSVKKYAVNSTQMTSCGFLGQSRDGDKRHCDYDCNCKEGGCEKLMLFMTQRKCKNTLLQLCDLQLHYPAPFLTSPECIAVGEDYLRTVTEDDICAAGGLEFPLFHDYCPAPGVYQCSADEVLGMQECSEVADQEGVFTLWNDKQVKCNMGWTSIMHMRMIDKLSADRNWTEYENGFGSLHNGSHWAGLKNTADIMARKSSWKLRFTIKTIDSSTITGTYNTFTLDANNDYRLNVGSFVGEAKYNLLACNIDTRRKQNGRKFSTKDKDHDSQNGNCAWYYGAGFWYNDCYSLGHRDYTKGEIGHYYSCESSYWQSTLKELRLEMQPN